MVLEPCVLEFNVEVILVLVIIMEIMGMGIIIMGGVTLVVVPGSSTVTMTTSG